MSDEVDIEVCCDILLDAINSGGLEVVEVKPGEYCEVVPDAEGKSGIAINYCPFCGSPRPYLVRNNPEMVNQA